MRLLSTSLLSLFTVLAASQVVWSQQPGTHTLYPHLNNAPAGYVGRLQLQRGQSLQGYYQPIEIKAAPWLAIAWADPAGFSSFRQAPVTLGLLVSAVYRFQVTGLPGNESASIYPTIEVIDRLYPPPGQAAKHPIPIEITAEDLRLALSGQFVTRVIYVEDPDQALPYVSDPNRPAWYDAGPTANPLNEADKLGRPVAILRIGGRQPDERTGPDATFMYGSPPLIVYQQLASPPVQEQVPTGEAEVIQAQFSRSQRK